MIRFQYTPVMSANGDREITVVNGGRGYRIVADDTTVTIRNADGPTLADVITEGPAEALPVLRTLSREEFRDLSSAVRLSDGSCLAYTVVIDLLMWLAANESPIAVADDRPTRFATRQDAIEQGILPALGAEAEGHDIKAICAETYGWVIDTDDAGNEVLGTGGFVQVVSVERFWEIVAKHDRSDLS